MLKEIEKLSGAPFEDKEKNSEQQATTDEARDNPKKSSMVRKHISQLFPHPFLIKKIIYIYIYIYILMLQLHN